MGVITLVLWPVFAAIYGGFRPHRLLSAELVVAGLVDEDAIVSDVIGVHLVY